ncbi:5-keto-4-deoxyuronate isomerase [Sinorhizobium fredii USDA 205]|uniref:4-deoxy-L-threo-5-hexosulose-uronate ketol-isomerase n=1 Tax=Rhizobium fredii TaxID=380 RepID=A0A844A6D4_RHIFR|nr:5-dehydro-4-deoxy-D-glucuronate isomerase [Sinorhizobium fredii]ASY72759.1 4-deoxy-L-threo-5-hexosulose-uronate ketol-isomerase [Sinorhizobium fredii CCBAU 83666]AWM28895.1 4-deoxy-L-threo-5-hexosulose-uronate ketol-isomerase [Sinorhizobium fredii CCBAU 25509]KSV86023.1 5-keto-4-deoxyuronate isomerase [Sinorhizobium fredii USDA 205]MCG5473456.1 5-dehydro-4-deoxy-D-glucuronate isomerase [Sinorhizobium fredii]MQW97785.1 5-dehydro-4-deoxy-D-glucuronate isomerase [Sinorhizobium fredii]
MQSSITVRHAVHYTQSEAMTGSELRQNFMIEELFTPGSANAVYTHYDRLLLIGVMPERDAITLGEGMSRVVGGEFLLERREMGLINIGGAGIVRADDAVFEVGFQDALYLGMGTRNISFESADPAAPAKFYINSAPAHAAFPARHIRKAEAIELNLGDGQTSNKRTLYQYIHPDVVESCQLLMGMTRLEPGSVWNTMPAHTHDRRMEAYLYFEVPKDAFVVHLMGRPEATGHLIVRNEQAVISPPWSVHCGAGTSSYAFIWSMAGDNKSFKDMDFVPMGDIR